MAEVSILSDLFDFMDRAINWILALLMATMVVIIAAQVWYRFVMNDPLAWSEELGRYVFVWISFIGAAAGVRYQVHLGIDLLQKLFAQNLYRYVVITVNLIIQIFLLMIIFWGFKILGVIKFQTSPSMNIPMIYPYLAVPVGCMLMFVNSMRISVAALKKSPLATEIRL